ncbi:type VI secretion system baseplate subunit TssK [Mesobaculum littorinae]|uniref:Type VI secretion system baseplate subunit TssK n=1 Tax=Mesobaculum littorinae TaxID=2486419 RepID=A0A438AHX1_9RHOB|nr:type VI secretion system baseplate subunit TssK [Mesobaculum littorinae]RVV98300.1 type VI secretion system baseplate subunit TssK [Mesobaculum littorinae]
MAKIRNRVAWTEGMFLRVQHFQQADRWTDQLVRDATRPLAPYPWGILEMAVDRAALGIGRFGLSSIKGILPDGTPFSAPEQCDLPAPVKLEEGISDLRIHLTLPMLRPGAAEFAPGPDPAGGAGTEGTGGGSGGGSGARMIRQDVDTDDANADTSFSAAIEIGRMDLSLRRADEELAGLETLPLARVVEVRSDLAVVLDDEMIPPVLTVGASPRLTGYLNELLGLLRHRSDAIARRTGDPSLRGSAELGDYLMLQALNRNTPGIAHLAAQAGQIHPETAYRALVSLAGELATFTAATRLPAELPDYRHADPAATFDPVMAELRRALSAVLDQSAVLIPLEERRHGVRVGMLADAGLKAEAGLVLAVRADIPGERLRRLLPNQIKVGPVERISELVNVALPGVEVRPMPVAPRQLPFRSGNTYFELDTTGEIWREVIASGTIAMHFSSEFPGLELELWGIRA